MCLERHYLEDIGSIIQERGTFDLVLTVENLDLVIDRERLQ